MFCGNTATSDDNKRKSNEIDKELKKEKDRLSRIIQLLLLGTGESGKTTIIKQMKIIHINGFSENEKLEKIPHIKQNIHESIYTLVSSMNKLNPQVSLQKGESICSADYILQLGPNEPSLYTEEYYDHIKTLWSDPGIQETFRRANEFQLIDSAKHFLDRIDEIRKSNYVPTTLDVLFCRVMTVAISKIEFKISYKGEKVEFWMYDVGGQRGERKKWISVFEGIRAILFLIAASDFDQTLREDEKKNRLKEALQVFSDIFWSRFVRQAGKIVFLNKQDLLQQKIENGSRLEKYFPEYALYKVKDKNSCSEYDKAKLYMKDLIIHRAQNKPDPETIQILPDTNVQMDVKDQPVYIHFTIATNTDNVKLVFDSVKDMILLKNLGDAGLY